jgi:translocation and assembly module TamB
MLVLAAGLVARFGALTGPGRGLIQSQLQGLSLGRYGRLGVSGLDGDIFSDFSVARLTLSDAKGPWIEARDIRVQWSWGGLVLRRVQIDNALALVRVMRRPKLGPAGPPSTGGLPLSLYVGRLRMRLETLPAFSVERGLFDVSARLRVRRANHGESGAIVARSLLHAGDAANLSFDLRPKRPLKLSLDALEARGGAIAGSLGLPANQPLFATARASGSLIAGRIDARLVSGAQTPLLARGAWTSAGGVVSARASLTASTLTRGYAGMLGPQAVIAAASRAAPKGQNGVAALVRTQNLTMNLKGVADLRTLRSDRGLDLAALVSDLSRLAPGKASGGGRVRGLLTGSPAAWNFNGAVSADRISGWGVELDQAGGRLAIAGRRGELDAQADVAATGRPGAAGLSGLIGSPKAVIDVARLKDGRLLLRKADITGAAFRMTASGSRGLLGGVSMEGKLDLANLSAFRRGAAGAMELAWSASEATARSPWKLSADGRGRGSRSGLSELDRLLGPSPKLSLHASYADGSFSIADVAVDGEKAAITASGRIDGHGALALKAQWRAEGPFQAGPVQISGKADGKGDVTGTLSAPRADLDADFAMVDVPNLPLTNAHMRLSFLKGPAGFQGQIAVNASSGYGPARAASAFRFLNDGVELTGIDANAGGVTAAGSLALHGGAPSGADLTLTAGPGAVLSQGRAGGTVKIVDGASPTAAIDLSAKGAVLRDSDVTLQSARLQASGPLSRLPFDVSILGQTSQGPLRFEGSGTYQGAGGAQEVAVNGSGQFRNVDFKTREPATLRLAGADRTLHGRIDLGGGRLALDARQTAQALQASANLKGVDIHALNPDFAGKIDADVTLDGSGANLDGVLTAQLEGARAVDSPAEAAVSGLIKAALKGGRVDLDADVSGAKGMKASLSAALPALASAAPLHLAIAKNRPVQGRFQADGEILPLWDLAYGGERELAGQAHLAGTFGGTLDDPQIVGQATVTGGSFSDDQTGLRLTALSISANLDRDIVSLTGLNAKDDKGGTVSGSGSFSLQRAGASDLKLNLSRFRLIDNDTGEATASGQVAVTRSSAGKVAISGELGLDRGQVNADAKIRPSIVTMDVTERNKPERFQEQTIPTPQRGPPVTLDVRLRAPDKLIVKGRGLNVELSLDAHVTGDLSSPNLVGVARVVRGSYDFAGKRFEFDDQGRIVLANSPDQIRLDLSASWEAPSLTANIKVGGTAAKPQITLTSTPTLPQDEIMSQVLFGTSASQLSGSQTAQIATTVGSLAAGGGFDVLGGLRQIAGLDRLALGGDQTSGMTIAGGKYISDNVYIEVIGGGRQGPSAEVDWTIRRGLAIVSQIGGQYGQSGQYGARLSIRWTHDIGKPRRALPGKG